METPNITLGGLLSVIQTEKQTTVNLFKAEDDLLIISFELKGYSALEDELEAAEVTSIEIPSLNKINVKIKTTD